MKELESIKNKISILNKKYSNHLLLGEAKLTNKDIEFLGRQAKTAVRKYERSEYISKEDSYILSLYAVTFAKHYYEGERFWESFSKVFYCDESFIRTVTIEAMKNVYEKEKWNYYRTTRTEYVETIRMHSIIGNDNSGDKIIYAFYLIFLKDFEKNVTQQKLKLFFPYLKELFERFGAYENNEYINYYDGIAYVRGQLPKSFVRAYILNHRSVSKLIEQLFQYFSSKEKNLKLPNHFDRQLLNKLDSVFKRNDHFKNEYTTPLINKKPLSVYKKEGVYYKDNETQLYIPTHFIDFKSNEPNDAQILIMDNDQLISNEKLEVSAGGIGWKSSPASYQFKKLISHLRYKIIKTETGETIYDSYQKFYRKQKKQKSDDRSVEQDQTKLYKVLNDGNLEQVKSDSIESGYIYVSNRTHRFYVRKSKPTITEKKCYFLMRDKTVVVLNGKTLENTNKSKILKIKNIDTLKDTFIVDNNEKKKVYTGDLLFSIVMRFPYSINELILNVNGKEMTGLEIREAFLNSVEVSKGGDYTYQLNLNDRLTTGANKLEFYFKIKDVKVQLTTLSFFYSKTQPFDYRFSQFNNQTFIELENDDYSVFKNAEKDTLYCKDEGKNLLWAVTVPATPTDISALSSKEFFTKRLYTLTGFRLDKEAKSLEIEKCFDNSYLFTEEHLLELTETIGTTSFLEQIKASPQTFANTLKHLIKEVDNDFLDWFIVSIKAILDGQYELDEWGERYLAPFFSSIDLSYLKPALENAVQSFMLSIDPDFSDLNYQLSYSYNKYNINYREKTQELIDKLSYHRKNSAENLYAVASKTDQSPIETLGSVKEIHTKNGSRSELEYFETVEWFRMLLNDKPIDISKIHTELFMDILLVFMKSFSPTLFCSYMNLMEKSLAESDKASEGTKEYVRNRLLEIAGHMDMTTELEVREESLNKTEKDFA